MTTAQTLYEKIWQAHVIEDRTDGTSLIYIDRHIVHEVTSPQAFDGLRAAGRSVRRPDLTLAVPDHNLPTTPRFDAHGRAVPIADPQSAAQLNALQRNTADAAIPYIDANDPRQGIVHVVGPEQGFSLPGTTIVCGDSHTASHGGLGALAFGIGTSEVEHVLATQTLLLKKSRTMEVRVTGMPGPGISAKDIILHIIGSIGTAGGTGSVIEYRGEVFEKMTIEERMTVCNMSIEAGARAGLVAPDQKVFEYLKGRPMAPTGPVWDQALAYWHTLKSDKGARFDTSVEIDSRHIEPTVSWGTSPEDVVAIGGVVPYPESFGEKSKQDAARRSLDYMGLEPGQTMRSIPIQNIFIGSCTNSRIEDLRAAARILKGRTKAESVRWAIVVPGSGLVKRQAESEGLDRIFQDAGFEWREPGCSACLAMNPDKVPPGERCASTSNRNFIGRQGPGARTHLVSPAMAAAAAINGHLSDVREFENLSR